jgi:thiol-disulfide isomerase/thioredoxin
VLCLIVILAVTARAHGDTPSPPVFRGDSGQFVMLRPIDPAPDVSVRRLDGTAADLRSFRGKIVVLNFWATWCLPCIREMPSLDRLAAERANDPFAVVAVSVDRDGASVVRPFVSEHQLTHLGVYLDPDQRLGSLKDDHGVAGALPIYGLPISYIIDPNGGVVGYLTGAANWDSLEARRFLDYFISRVARRPRT